MPWAGLETLRRFLNLARHFLVEKVEERLHLALRQLKNARESQ